MRCKCKDPVPQDVVSYGGDKPLEQCGVCHRVLKDKCHRCCKWYRDIKRHDKNEHPAPKEDK